MTRTRPHFTLGRPDGSIAPATILLGDVLVLLAFVGTGLLSHSIEPWRFPSHTLTVVTPFLLAWLVVAPLLGLYRHETRFEYQRAALLTINCWIVASLLGGAIRATSYFPGGAPIDFLLVNVVFGLAFFLPWRLAVVAVSRRWRP